MILNRRLRNYKMGKENVSIIMNDNSREFYSPIELASYEKKKHIPLNEAYSLIEKEGLDPARLKTVIENGEIHSYEFDKQPYVSRLDIGRVYHQPIEKPEGLNIERYFTKKGEDPFDSVNFQKVDVVIKDYKSQKTIFEMKNVEVPEWMDEISASIVASRYFFKPDKQEWKEKMKTKLGMEYEHSLKDLNQRVADFFADEGNKFGYFSTQEDKNAFRDELLYIQSNGLGAFNSPVQFNAGIFNSYGITGSKGPNFWIDPQTNELKKVNQGEYVHPQLHACFIKGPADDLESILEHGVDEGAIFASGSGIGQDIGALREDGGILSGGGKASGPKSFTIYYDKGAGTIKSGGKTRRAARMTNMFQNHPDIMEFIRMKTREDHKALMLIQAGYSEGMDGEAYQTVAFQNTNFSVRLDNTFFEKLQSGGDIELLGVKDGKVKGKVKAEQMLKEIAYGSWRIGDPAVQYDSQIQKMHTCPNSGQINASNPCGEYFNIDDTSCNLFSVRMTAFFDENGKFDVNKYKKVIRIAAIAQDIANKTASYPVKSIARTSPEFGAIGMGYSDFGAALMRLGIPYDSNKARKMQGVISALMTGTVYETSAELAKHFGTFTHFELNKKEMLNVMKTHKKSLDELLGENSFEDEELKNAAIKSWENVLTQGEINGFRNSQATAIAPTGTISFLMGSSTTGIEPVYALLTTKALAGGGTLTLINKDVKIALEKLGYNENQIKDIEQYAAQEVKKFTPRNTVRGAPHLKEEHYAIFDTAQGGYNGKGSIDSFGHIGMVAAAQPFISGGISKTINMPKSTKVKEIYDGYLLGQELKLKGLTFFRDESKPSAVLGLSKSVKKLERGEKEDLPPRRDAFETELEISTPDGPISFHIITSEYSNGLPGQITFLSYKAGSTLGATLSTAGVLASKALRRGVSLDDVTQAWIGQEFKPNGFVQGSEYVKLTSSFLDLAGKILRLEYLGDVSMAQDPDKVDLKSLRGYKTGAFRTLKRAKLDSWKFEDVINDFEWGGFVKPSAEDITEENGNHTHSSSSGRMCNVCGREMKRDGVNCFHCETCGDKVGGCGG
jgi:ribonucleoside-diphosphate reductase alpha chain